MKTVKNGTKEASAIISIFTDNKWSNKGSIYEAYGKPSATKVKAWKDIEARAKATAGYDDNLRVCSRNGYCFSTIYSYTTDEATFIVYDTKRGTKVVECA